VYDPAGKCGKSKWSKYMMYHHNAAVLDYDTATNLRYQVINAGAKTLYILDASRCRPKSISECEFYSALENIKNGCVRSNKYEGGSLMMMPPHVIVMSNQQPAMENWSADRLKIFNLTDPRLMEVTNRDRVSPYMDMSIPDEEFIGDQNHLSCDQAE